MRKTLLAVFAATALLNACTDAPKADDTTATDAQQVAQTGGETYKADLTESKLEWIGTKPTGRHNGTIDIKDGILTAENNNISGGKFTLDITTIKPLDQEDAKNEKLRGHLLSADFFEADKYPEAVFEITNVTAGVNTEDKDLVMKDATHTITGNLTMKGVTKSISFPAKVTANDSQITADANFNIIRTDWGINYQSDESIQDKFIDKKVNLQLHLATRK